MDPHDNEMHPLFELFNTAIRQSANERGLTVVDDEIKQYLTSLLVQFLHTDQIFAITDRRGRRLRSVAEMIAEGDVLLNADSFERERQVHKHIGDFILFWAGIYPEFLRRIKLDGSADLMCDYVSQGKRSYYLVSTFDHGRYSDEAPIFRTLSLRFEDFALCLSCVRNQLPHLSN